MQTSMTASGKDGAAAGMAMRMRIEAQRVGECTGDEG
jgi:hypothetical protein